MSKPVEIKEAKFNEMVLQAKTPGALVRAVPDGRADCR
jgi:hypothetical protein